MSEETRREWSQRCFWSRGTMFAKLVDGCAVRSPQARSDHLLSTDEHNDFDDVMSE
jgi:hypothetical protein